MAQALPTYTMSTFDIPTKACDKLDALTRKFGGIQKNPNGSYLAWLAWEKLCLPKGIGGMGFKKSKDFNKALLAKLAWMIASKRDSLCMNLLRSKYKVKENWLQSEPSKNASPIWKEIEKTKPLIAKGACYLVGNGASINVWVDPWIPWLVRFKPTPKDDSIQQNPLMVSNLISTKDHCWNLPILNELFNSKSVEAIQKNTYSFERQS